MAGSIVIHRSGVDRGAVLGPTWGVKPGLDWRWNGLDRLISLEGLCGG